MPNRPTVQFNPIGVIRTPYTDKAPYQPIKDDDQEFSVVVDPEYAAGLKDLDRFSYVILLYYIDRLKRDVELTVTPFWTDGLEVGLFSSRSPLRPNPIGLSVTRIKRIEGNVIHTDGLDVFDQTPLLDIKPYIKDLDSKANANYGWLDDMEDKDHLWLHVMGVPHEY